MIGYRDVLYRGHSQPLSSLLLAAVVGVYNTYSRRGTRRAA